MHERDKHIQGILPIKMKWKRKQEKLPINSRVAHIIGSLCLCDHIPLFIFMFLAQINKN